MEPEPHKAPIRFYEIDLLRFLAALSVVIYHYTYRGFAQGHYSPLAFPQLGQVTRYGYLGVELFFIISGYVVLLSAQGKTVLTFAVKKLWGTLPADGLMSERLHASVGQYAYNMTMLQSFFQVFDLDGAYWSLAVEISFYFLVSIIIGYQLMRHLDWVLLGWLGFIALPGRFHAGSAFDVLLFTKYAPYFIAGMVFYMLQQPNGRTRFRYGLLAAAYLLALRACWQSTSEMAVFLSADLSHWITAAVITIFFFIFYLVAFRKVDLSRFTWLAWLGALTYPLYLLHGDIAFIAFHRLAGSVNKYALVGAAIAAMLAGAYLIHRFVEKRFSKLLGLWVDKGLDALARRQ
jgi:peptidoglycan/LPS O-acetylase OafA/YrhL